MIIQAKSEHEVTYKDLCELVNRHPNLNPVEILAIAANMIGKLIALQDQRVVTPAMAMEIVANNIEYGNKQIIDSVLQSKGTS